MSVPSPLMHYDSNERYIAITGFSGQYTGSRKEVDAYIQLKDERFPKLVIESGFSQRVPALSDRKDLWLLGGAGHVRLVIII